MTLFAFPHSKVVTAIREYSSKSAKRIFVNTCLEKVSCFSIVSRCRLIFSQIFVDIFEIFFFIFSQIFLEFIHIMTVDSVYSVFGFFSIFFVTLFQRIFANFSSKRIFVATLPTAAFDAVRIFLRMCFFACIRYPTGAPSLKSSNNFRVTSRYQSEMKKESKKNLNFSEKNFPKKKSSSKGHGFALVFGL